MSWAIRERARAAARREQRLIQAITERGRERGMEGDRVSDAIDAARAEIHRRGESYEQIMGDLPIEPTECCGDCYEHFMESDDCM